MVKNVLDWLEKTSEKYASKTAYEDSNEKVIFSEVIKEAKSAGYYILKNVKESAPVAVMMGRGVHTIVTYLGVVYSGHTYAPIDVTLPDERLEKIFDTLKPSCVVTDDEGFERASVFANKLGINVYNAKNMSGDYSEEELSAVRKNMVMTDPLYVIFTSGSSGRPKGVLTSHQSLMCYIRDFVSVMGINEKDKLGCQSPLDYIAAIRDIYVPLLTGASTFIIPKEYFMQPEELFDMMNSNSITAVGWSTSALSVLTKLGAFNEKKLNTLKKICFSGSVMPPKVLRIWQENLPEALFVNQYGPTEATASCTCFVVDHLVEEDEAVLIGKAYDDYKVFLLKEDDTLAETGEEGEICVAGPILALGYYADMERTKAAFTVNPLVSAYEERIYRTGDIGVFREDGNLEFHGRKDRQIKYMGHRVELDEIEIGAMSCNGVKEAAAIYDSKSENIWLFYTGEVTKKDIAIALRKLLPGFMIPRKIKELEEMPKLPNGKLDMTTLKTFI